MIVYLSHPYTGDEVKNIEHASSIALQLSYQYTVFSPLNNFTFINSDFTYGQVMKMCLDMLEKCDKLIYYGHSNGVDTEIAFARKIGIPVEEWTE